MIRSRAISNHAPDCDRSDDSSTRNSTLVRVQSSPTAGAPSASASSRIARSRAFSIAIRASRASACRRRSNSIAVVFACKS